MSAAMATNGNFHRDGPDTSSTAPSSPSSPTASSSIQSQQAVPRPYISLNVRGQNSPFPSTPTSSQMNGSSILEPPPGVAYNEFIRTWTDHHVARWLADIKCGSHASTFKANDIRGDILLELDQITLKEMGVSSIGDRLRIVNAVKALRAKKSARTISSHRPTLSTDPPNDIVTKSPQDRTAETSPTSRLTARRLESGRPAPLQLNSSHSRSDLPRLIREHSGPDSARSTTTIQSQSSRDGIRPLPQPTPVAPTSQALNTPNTTHSTTGSLRPGLPPLPPPPRGQPPPPPPNRTPARGLLNGASQLTGRRTPTQEVPPYATQPPPPAPQNQSLLTPSSASNWAGYHLPSDPRPGNPGGGKTPRSTSPLPPSRAGSIPRTGGSPAHGRNTSLGNNSPSTSSSAKLPPRPSTTNSHPYANAQPALQPPSTAAQAYNLSPIAESFINGNNSGTPSPPTSYTVGRGPFTGTSTPHGAAPSLDDLRRKLVKFLLPEEGQSCKIEAANCAGGIEVLEKVLKKFGKGGSRADGGMDHVQTDAGGLIVDGWGVYLDWGQDDGPGEPLTEAELLSVCHASPDHPAREHGLTLRRTAKTRRYDERSGTISPTHGKFLATGQTGKNTKRASSISILSGLGVRDPEKALDPPSPTQSVPSDRRSPVPSNVSISKKPSKLRSFFGQRPPSELITTHLTEFFPNTEKKVLERTARHSMMRISSGRRDSTVSWNPSATRTSMSPTRTSFSSLSIPPPLPEKSSPPPEKQSPEPVAGPSEDIPRMSLSTEDGRFVDLHSDDEPEPETPMARTTQPQLLPPIPFPTQSFSESLESITGVTPSTIRPASGFMSNASKRMSFMTELRSKRDRSDTASLMTVDEITAKVESRRQSMGIDPNTLTDTDDWTKVDAEEDIDTCPVDATLGSEEESEEEEDEEDEEDTLADSEDDDKPSKATTTAKATKWIKGALIGAGSFGKVYLGMDASNGLLMAVKQVELPTSSAPNQERKKSMLSALEREIELLKDLQHENIVQYLYSSLDDDYLNIFLEYVPGGSVTALLSNYGAFEETLVKNFVRQILEGLNYLHERDIIHRDIKGANILVDNKGGIKISDFGISKKVEDNLLAGNRVHRPSLQGSVFWMAPEVVKQTGHTRKADIWSVGCLVVEMLTGEHPWAQLTQMQAIFKIGSSAKPTIPSDISAEAQDFLLRTFELDHEARPSAGELLQHPWIAKKRTKGAKAAAAVDVTA